MALIDILPPVYATIPILVQYKLGGTSYVFRNAASYKHAGQWRADVSGFTVITGKRKEQINDHRTPAQ